MMYLEKEWKELSRGKGLWLALAIIVIISIFLLMEARSFPSEHGFEVFLLSLFDMNIYLIPLLCLFISSFAIIQEKELKTLLIVLTKKETYRSFLLKKSIAIHTITLGIFLGWYVVFALPMKLYLSFNVSSLLYFLAATTALILIFNQIGMMLGSICSSRMQLIGANTFIWFFFLFLIDLIFLYFLPQVTYANVKIFSVLYFLDPVHALRFFLETSIGLFSLEYMSRLMEKMVWMSPGKFFLLNIVIWLTATFELSVWFRAKEGRG